MEGTYFVRSASVPVKERTDMTYSLEEIRNAHRILADIEALKVYAEIKELEGSSVEIPRTIMKLNQLADLFGVSERSIRNYRDQPGGLPHIKDVTHKFDLREAWDWMKANRANIVTAMDPEKITVIEMKIRKTR